MCKVFCLLHGIFGVIISAYPWIQRYPNSTIDHILNATESGLGDKSIIYLGHRLSVDDCVDNCIDLNYLCGKSTDNIYIFADGGEWQFDNTTCSASSTHTSTQGQGYGSSAILTSNIVSNEYWIDIQLSVINGEDGCIFLNSEEATAPKNSAFQCVNPDRKILFSGFYNGGYYDEYLRHNFNFEYSTKYNTSSYFNNNRFTAFVNGEQLAISESIPWSGNYAGLRTYNAHVIYHSFKMRFPNLNDNTDEKVCRAYMYGKHNGDCYGYYGNDYAFIQNSISSDITNQYDSGIIYDTAQPTQTPTAEPTAASQTPTAGPTAAPQTTFNPTAFTAITNEPTADHQTTFNPTAFTSITNEPTADRQTTLIASSTDVETASNTVTIITNVDRSTTTSLTQSVAILKATMSANDEPRFTKTTQEEVPSSTYHTTSLLKYVITAGVIVVVIAICLVVTLCILRQQTASVLNKKKKEATISNMEMEINNSIQCAPVEAAKIEINSSLTVIEAADKEENDTDNKKETQFGSMEVREDSKSESSTFSVNSPDTHNTTTGGEIRVRLPAYNRTEGE